MTTYSNSVAFLRERILKILNKGDIPRDTNYELRDIEYMVRDSIGKFILQSWAQARAMKEGVDVTEAFLSTITKEVQEDVKKRCYIDLDFDWVNFPDGSGIQSVRPSLIEVDPLYALTPNMSGFIPIPARFDDIYRNLPAQALEGQIGWALRGKRIYFTNLLGQNLIQLGLTHVDIDVVSTSENVLGQEKPISIPPDIADGVVRDVVAFFMPTLQTPKDMLNDNNPNLKPVRS